MYECPNCGGALKFDIPSQQLKCDYCNTFLDPYTPLKAKNAVGTPSQTEETPVNSQLDMAQAPYKRKMRPTYEATIFTCPQCGGEILSTDHEAAGFCSFCGVPTIFEMRMSQEESPEFIIPFQKTKEDCKREYANLLNRAIFAPKELKDPQYIDGFRGIYMPYWAYMITHKGHVDFSGSKSYRRGDYDYTDTYRLSANVDAYYKGIAYDASSSFDDNISETIAPYDVRGMKQFTPTYLSGFYGDTADVDSKIYEEDARQFANERTYETASKVPAFSGFGFRNDAKSNPYGANATLHTSCAEVNSTMFPVWFLSYRKGNRVAYATVNGQTGKVAADVPVDVKKYVIGSLVLTIPIFILLNLFLSMKATSLLTLAAGFAVLSIFLYWEEMKKIVERDLHENDKGLNYKTQPHTLYEKNQRLKKKKSAKGTDSVRKWLTGGTAIFIWIVCIFPLLSQLIMMFMRGSSLLLMIAVAVATLIGSVLAYQIWVKWEDRKILPGFMWSMIAVAIAFMITLCNPSSDIFYYVGTILSIGAVCVTMMEIITTYNVLATRKLPQFNKTGGDDRA